MEWERLYAFLIQNSSLTMDDIMKLTIPQLEYLVSGIQKNNKTETGDKEVVLRGHEAIKAMAKI